MINNIYQKLTDYLKDCPELGNYIYFNVIPLDVDTASVNSNPASTVLNEYVDGSKEVRLLFNINIVKEYDDDEAVLAMVDSNLQREEILPSEKAFAYKMKYDAMRRKAGRPSKNNSSQFGRNFQTDIVLAEQVGESRGQLHRYLRLVELIPPILDLVDKKALALATAVEVSFLGHKIQAMLYDYMLENDICTVPWEVITSGIVFIIFAKESIPNTTPNGPVAEWTGFRQAVTFILSLFLTVS